MELTFSYPLKVLFARHGASNMDETIDQDFFDTVFDANLYRLLDVGKTTTTPDWDKADPNVATFEIILSLNQEPSDPKMITDLIVKRFSQIGLNNWLKLALVKGGGEKTHLYIAWEYFEEHIRKQKSKEKNRLKKLIKGLDEDRAKEMLLGLMDLD